MALRTGNEQIDRAIALVESALARIEAVPFARGIMASVVASTLGAFAASTQNVIAYRGSGGHQITLASARQHQGALGHWVALLQVGTGRVTLLPQTGETINGLASWALDPGRHALLVADGDRRWTLIVRNDARDWQAYAHSPGGGGLTAWQLAGVSNAAALTTGAPTANVLRAIPFVAPARGGTLDLLAFEVTGGVAGNYRIGLYESTSEANLYPSKLLVDSGNIDVTGAAVKTATVSVALTPGALYWVAVVGSVAPTVRACNLANLTAALGIAATFGAAPNVGISVAHAFAALPATFTGGGAYITAVPVPALAYRVT